MLKIIGSFLALLLICVALETNMSNIEISKLKTAVRVLTPQATAICHSQHQTFYKIYPATAEPEVLCTGNNQVIYTYQFVPTDAIPHNLPAIQRR